MVHKSILILLPFRIHSSPSGTTGKEKSRQVCWGH